jgi:hypothetical protein
MAEERAERKKLKEEEAADREKQHEQFKKMVTEGARKKEERAKHMEENPEHFYGRENEMKFTEQEENIMKDAASGKLVHPSPEAFGQ